VCDGVKLKFVHAQSDMFSFCNIWHSTWNGFVDGVSVSIVFSLEYRA